MKTLTFWCAMLVVAGLAVGCGGGDGDGDHGHSHGNGDHDHGHGGDHSHSHDDDPNHSHEGKRYDLGSLEIGGSKVVMTQVGELEPGGNVVYEMKLSGDAKVDAVRIWVGNEAGEGSIKQKAEGKDGDYHAHVELEEKWPADSQVWVELESESGSERGSFKPGDS